MPVIEDECDEEFDGEDIASEADIPQQMELF
jgi:hypothetical protein